MKRKIFAKIYDLVKKIPKGKVLTYGLIAKRLKVNPQVVGWALHANKNSKIPCHRVVDRNGRLAKNYALGGRCKQREKLKKEGVGFKDRFRVDFKKQFSLAPFI